MENTQTTPAWTDAEQKVIQLFVEKHGQTRGNAIRRMRGMLLRGITPEQILAAPVEPKISQVQEPKVKKEKSAPKAKKEKKPSIPGKAERLKMAEKQGVSELTVYLELCRKHGVTPAASAVKRQAQLEKNEAKREKSEKK